tara:strand:+ start:3021 stop:4634 length:1614 start_codon:yes stop_codon:yes gene_type:complete
MATAWQTFPVEFKGGLISNLSPLQHGTQAVGSATILQNFEPSLQGGYAKIKGYSKFNSNKVEIGSNTGGTNKITNLTIVDVNTTIATRLDSASANYCFYHVTPSTVTLAHTVGGGSAHAGRSVSPHKVRSVIYNFNGNDKAVFVDGVNYPAYYDSSASANACVSFVTSTTGGGANAVNQNNVLGAKFVALYKDCLFFVVGNNLTSMAIKTDLDWSTGTASITRYQDEITGLIPFRDQLILFTRQAIYKITGTSNAFKSEEVTQQIGCIEPDTIKEVGGDILFMAPDGIRSLAATDRIGDFNLDVASAPIKKDIDNFTSGSFQAVTLREKAQYRIFKYNAATQDETAEGYLATKYIAQGGTGLSWAKTVGINAYVTDSRYMGQTGVSTELILFANKDGYIYKMDTTDTFDGDTIEALFESPPMPVSDPLVRKTFYKVVLYIDAVGTFNSTLSLRYDEGSPDVIQPQPITFASGTQGAVLYGTSTYGSTGNYGTPLDVIYSSNVVGSGKTVTLRIEDKVTTANYRLDTALLEYSNNDRQ